jgi:hypothetical protein
MDVEDHINYKSASSATRKDEHSYERALNIPLNRALSRDPPVSHIENIVINE